MSTVATTTSPLSTHVGDVTNVLFMAAGDDRRAHEGCMELLTSAPPSRANVLCVTAAGSPDQHVQAWDHHVGDPLPARIGFIDIAAKTRSSADTVGEPADPISIQTVEHPGDLLGIEITRSRYQSAWDGDDNRLLVCVDSLNPMLEHVPLERAFRFLNALTGRFRAADAIAHYHLDPSGVDGRTLNTIKGLFDAVIEPDQDGEWRIRTR